MSDTPRVWIACLAAYNEGHLHGEWVDATDADELHEVGKRIIASSPAMYAEELAIHDYDNFPGAIVRQLGEYPRFETLANVASALEEHGEAFGAWLGVQDSALDLAADDLGSQFEEHFRGEWDSEEAFAMEQVCEIGWGGISAQLYEKPYASPEETINVFDELASYLNWESIAREMFQHGNYTSVRMDGGTYSMYVFEDEV